jgi:hypothetical protein
MGLCTICGGADYLRCGCSIEPYCDTCDENDQCNSEMDSLCVIYHPTYPGQTPLPSKLTNLGLPNGSSAQTIFEAIDAYLANSVNTPIVPIDTNSIDLTVSGFANHHLQADVRISTNTNNQLSVQTNGLYSAPYNDLFQVNVTSGGTPGYLGAKIEGGTDGCVSINASIVADQVLLTPTLDLQCLANAYCSGGEATARGTLAACLFGTAFSIADTSSIHLSFVGGLPKVLTATSKISATAGNSIVINSDGLFVPTPSTIVTADNGLNVTSGPVELGGTLIKNTTIDFGAAFQMNFINTPKLSIGSSAASNSYLTVVTTDPTISVPVQFSATQNLSNTVSYGVSNSILVVNNSTSFTGTAALFNFGNGGQLFFENTAAVTITGSGTPILGGIYGVVVTSNAASVSGNTVSGGHFQGAGIGSGNVSDMAAVRACGLNTTGSGSYTGTVTNYYGLKIEDIGASTYGSRVTNKFAILQVGASDISRFFGPVQNASSSVQFTSDARVKENIVPFTRGLDVIDNINTKSFNYTYNKGKTVTGIIAQELESYLPEAVQKGNFAVPNGETYTDFRMVDQTTLFYTMLNAIKDLSIQNKALTNRVIALESK